MKTLYIIQIVLALIFYSSGVSFADEWKNESGKGRPAKSHHHPDDGDYKKRPEPQGHHEHERRPDYKKYHGYRECPYDKGRHYGHYKHNKHRYEYHGHWRSWEQWDRYANRHPHMHEHGHYYREHDHLMFRYCEPGTGECFFFSIGR